MADDKTKKTPFNAKTIDEAIQRAKEKQAERDAANGGKKKELKAAKEPKAPKEKPVKEPKAAKEPKAPKEKPVREPTHLKKINAAAAALPALDETTGPLVSAIDRLSASQLAALSAHVTHISRAKATTAAVTAEKPTVGALVRIVSCNQPKWVGATARLVEVRNIRCFADVLGPDGEVVKEKLYLFISDVETVSEPDAPPADEAPEAEPAPEDAAPTGDLVEPTEPANETAPAEGAAEVPEAA